MKLLKKTLDIHLPSVGAVIRVTEDGVEVLAERVNVRAPAQGVFHVDKDNWIITPAPEGGISLESADAIARFQQENADRDRGDELQLVTDQHTR